MLIILANVTVVLVTSLDKELHTTTNLGITSLAVADLLLALSWFYIQVLVFQHQTMITNIHPDYRQAHPLQLKVLLISALLCHKDIAQGKQSPLLGACLAFRCVLTGIRGFIWELIPQEMSHLEWSLYCRYLQDLAYVFELAVILHILLVTSGPSGTTGRYSQAYYISFPCMEATYPYPIKNQ